MDPRDIPESKIRTFDDPSDRAGCLELVDLCLKEGRYQEAYRHLAEATEETPGSAEILATAGALAVRLERYEDALSYLLRASALSPYDKNLFHNIGLLHATREELCEAENAFRKVIELDPDDAQGFNDLAVVLAHRKKPIEARKAFEMAIDKNPAFEKAYENFAEFCLEERLYSDGLKAVTGYLDRVSESPRLLRWRCAFEEILDSSGTVNGRNSESGSSVASEQVPAGLKIAFFATQPSFAEDILRHLSERNEIRRFAGNSAEQISELMCWADLAWFEWCDQLLIEATRLPKTCRILCRLHSYEAFTDMPARVDWTKVEKLILVSRNVEQVLDKLHSIPADKEIIHNGVDIDRFVIPRGKSYGKKVCSLGYINYKKNPGLLLYCFKAIHDVDPDFEFHIAGSHQDPRIEIYMDHMIERLDIPLHFDGWIDDVPAYLKDKDFVISTSYFESFHYSIAEGMASGVMPLIHAWPGSEAIYPSDYLFDTPYDCSRLVRRLQESDLKKLAEENREYIAQRYPLENALHRFDRVIKAICQPQGAREYSMKQQPMGEKSDGGK